MRATIFAAAAAALFTAALAQDAPPERKMADAGDWRAVASEPDAAGGGCDCVWACVPREAIGFFEDKEEIQWPSLTRTRGECGDDDCRVCAAPKPNTACAWEIVEKTEAGG